MTEPELWRFLFFGYLLTIALELPVLLAGLAPIHSWPRRIAAGLWLTACTYPVVVLVLPLLLAPFHSRLLYLVVAESFAIAAECVLFAAAFGKTKGSNARFLRRDLSAVAMANLLSFSLGELLRWLGWLG